LRENWDFGRLSFLFLFFAFCFAQKSKIEKSFKGRPGQIAQAMR